MIPSMTGHKSGLSPCPETRVATLCYIVQNGKTLLLRKTRGRYGGGKWNAPGGKVRNGETPLRAAIRETREETGLIPLHLQHRGSLLYRIVGCAEPEWIVLVFVATRFRGKPRAGPEGRIRWFPVSRLPLHQMWQDDLYWLERLLTGETILGIFYFDRPEGTLLKAETFPGAFAFALT
ncbi:MAG: 8-oxo-dGTP diphosphatase [bacterium JZ-2024 1]